MKKVVCVILCVCFAFVVLVVPCFAVDWFGSGVTGYTYTITNRDSLPYTASNAVTAVGELNVMGVTIHDGESWYATLSGSTWSISVNGSWRGDPSTYSATFTIAEPSYTAYANSVKTGTPVGSDGFVDSGFSTALEICGDVVHYVLNNTYLLVAIGLAVALPLVAWGISKVKTLIVGY